MQLGRLARPSNALMPAKLFASGGICEPVKLNQPVSTIDWMNAMSPRTPSTRPSLMKTCASLVTSSCNAGTFGGELWFASNQLASWAAVSRFGPMTGVWVVTVAPAIAGSATDDRDAERQRRARDGHRAEHGNKATEWSEGHCGITISSHHRSSAGLLETWPGTSASRPGRCGPGSVHPPDEGRRPATTFGSNPPQPATRRRSPAGLHTADLQVRLSRSPRAPSPVPSHAGSRACRWQAGHFGHEQQLARHFVTGDPAPAVLLRFRERRALPSACLQQAATRSPHRWSGTPTTSTSNTSGCDFIALSTSSG